MNSLAIHVGCLHSEMECSHVINLANNGILPSLKHRLTEKEKRMIQPGYAFVYSEEESGIIRWTDSRTWTPSRALGPFMMYIEKREDHPLIKKIYTARYRETTVHLVIYNVHNHEVQGICCDIYKEQRAKIIPESYGELARTHLSHKKKRSGQSKNLLLLKSKEKNATDVSNYSNLKNYKDLKDEVNQCASQKDREEGLEPADMPKRSLLYDKGDLYFDARYQNSQGYQSIQQDNKFQSRNEYSFSGGYYMMDKYNSYNPSQNGKYYNQYLTLDQYVSHYDITTNCDNTSYIDLSYSLDEVTCEPIEISKEEKKD